MGDLANKWVQRLGTGWFWLSVVLILPNCSFSVSAGPDPNNLDRGPFPRDSVVFCDIEKALGRRCATSTDLATGIRLSEAAIALNEGRTSNVGLDDSAAALAKCGGEPEAILFEGPFPQGFPVCLNCGVIGTTYTSGIAACRSRCLDFYGFVVGDDDTFVPEKPPNPSVLDFCNAHAGVSTNMPTSTCFPGACSTEGTLLTSGWTDPRILPEPVVWQDLIGVATGGAAGSDLTRTAPLTNGWDAGAVSTQWITGGDAFVEFAVANASQLHVIGLSQIPSGCASPCPDTSAHFNPIAFAVHFKFDGRIYLLESGAGIVGPDVDGSFGTYVPGERFRVRLRDNGDGTAQVRYTRLVGACVPGTMCNETDLSVSATPASYPLRVDTSLFTPGATFTDVRLVRIR
jgi:hypothetical protein